MPLPTYDALMLPLLRSLADGSEQVVRAFRDRPATEFDLTDAERAEVLPVFGSRVGWAKVYLEEAHGGA